jgi:hypothetical protein
MLAFKIPLKLYFSFALLLPTFGLGFSILNDCLTMTFLEVKSYILCLL